MLRPLLTALALGAALLSPAKADDRQAKPLVTIVTSPEPQTQLMAMVLTMQAVQQGASAHILLCGPGGDLALNEAPEGATAPQKPRNASPQGLLRKIMETGTPVEVCAIYLPNKGADPDVLLDGITVAKPPAMAAKLLEDDARILSF